MVGDERLEVSLKNLRPLLYKDILRPSARIWYLLYVPVVKLMTQRLSKERGHITGAAPSCSYPA